jgi:hypothetical protein
VNVAVVLLAVLCLANLLTPLMPERPPASAVYLLMVLGALGLWMLARWALWLTIVVSVFNILAAAPGLVFAPEPTEKRTFEVFSLLHLMGRACCLRPPCCRYGWRGSRLPTPQPAGR